MAGITSIKRKGFAGGGKDASTKSFDASANPGRIGGPIGREDRVSHGATKFESENQGFTPSQIANQNAVIEQYRKNQAIKKDIQDYLTMTYKIVNSEGGFNAIEFLGAGITASSDISSSGQIYGTH